MSQYLFLPLGNSGNPIHVYVRLESIIQLCSDLKEFADSFLFCKEFISAVHSVIKKHFPSVHENAYAPDHYERAENENRVQRSGMRLFGLLIHIYQTEIHLLRMTTSKKFVLPMWFIWISFLMCTGLKQHYVRFFCKLSKQLEHQSKKK